MIILDYDLSNTLDFFHYNTITWEYKAVCIWNCIIYSWYFLCKMNDVLLVLHHISWKWAGRHVKPSWIDQEWHSLIKILVGKKGVQSQQCTFLLADLHKKEYFYLADLVLNRALPQSKWSIRHLMNMKYSFYKCQYEFFFSTSDSKFHTTNCMWIHIYYYVDGR